eukprot:scaffold38490_cov62-Phaeocystis_antarctica.AAC.4
MRPAGWRRAGGTSPLDRRDGFPRWSRVQRRSPIKARGRLLELRCRARPHRPSAHLPAQHDGPHLVGYQIVRRRPHNPRRQCVELLVVPPLRLGHLGARLLCQHAEDPCRGHCPALRAHRVALLRLEEPLRGLHQVRRVTERCTEVAVRLGPVGPQCDGFTVDLGFFTPVLFDGVPHALGQQLLVLVAGLRGNQGCLLRDLAIQLLHNPSILIHLPMHLHLLVIHRVPLPSARVSRAVDAAPVRRRHLQLDANRANFVLFTAVVHVRRQPGAAEASEAYRHVRWRAALFGSGFGGSGRRGGSGWRGGGLRGLALSIQHRQRLADLLVARSQVRLLLPQLGEQRFGAELGVGQPQSADGLQEAVGHATSPTRPTHGLKVWEGI